MDNKYFLSICIPSYNRPETLKRALKSVDAQKYADEIQIVICEDFAPKRLEVRSVVEEYKANSRYAVKYVENEVNYGHGKNWRQCSIQADGEYLLYVGDDDGFIPQTLDVYIEWLKEHPRYCYILRSYIRKYGENKDKIEYFRYYDGDKFFEKGEEAYKAFFLKSVSMSGYTIKRECALQYLTSDLDGTLLFQLYLLAEVCLKYPSAYCNTPCCELISDQIPLFGSSEAEKKLYTPGIKNNADNDLKFLLGFFRITEYIDKKYNLNSTSDIKLELSKYSFPILDSKRNNGIKVYNDYSKKLREIGLDSSKYFTLYYWALLIFGSKFCISTIHTIKKLVGRRLHL
jgi:glycosyltransferase involved in cell wall biosynthesis